jgi:hypothetical protein
VCYPCAAMQARCCCDSQNALVQGRCAIPALSCKLAAVVIHRMLWWKKGVLSCAAMQARCCCDSQNALVQEGCAIPALSCKQAAVMIHRMLWWKKGVCYPCAAMQAVVIHRMLWWKKGVLSCAAMQARCCCDHRMLWWKKGVLSLRCHANSAAVEWL